MSRPYKCAQVVWVRGPRDTCGFPGLKEPGCPNSSAPGSSGAELPCPSRRFLSPHSACSTTWCCADVGPRAVRPCCPPGPCCPRCPATPCTGTHLLGCTGTATPAWGCWHLPRKVHRVQLSPSSLLQGLSYCTQGGEEAIPHPSLSDTLPTSSNWFPSRAAPGCCRDGLAMP